MWIESHGNLARHPKTRRLMQRMGWTLPFTIGNLHLLWWWAMDFAPDGDLTRFEPDQITADLDLGGATPEQFLEVMVQAGFLDRIDGVLCIHDWPDYTARSVRSKSRKSVSSLGSNEMNSTVSEPASSCALRSDQMVEHAPQGAVRVDCIEQCSSRHGGSEVSGGERSQLALRAVPGINTPGPVSNVAQTFPTRDAASAEQEPVSHTVPAPAPTTPAIPHALAELPSFTDTWWPKLLDIHEANGTPLSTDAQRELLATLAEKPFSAVEELRARINDAANTYARVELLENTS